MEELCKARLVDPDSLKPKEFNFLPFSKDTEKSKKAKKAEGHQNECVAEEAVCKLP